jgi:hypothetical protein
MRLLIDDTSQINGEVRAAKFTLTALDTVVTVVHVHLAVFIKSEDFLWTERDTNTAAFAPFFVDLYFQVLFILAQAKRPP